MSISLTNCDECTKARKWRNTGRTNEHGAIIRQCRNCGHYQAEPPPQGLNYPKRFLYYDIENTKMTVETFDLSVPSKRLSWKAVKQPPFIICWSAALLSVDCGVGDIRVYSDSVTPAEAHGGNDKRCLAGLQALLNKADWWVGHNLKAFDTKKTQLRFLLNRMSAPDLSVKQVDTLTLARKYFKNDSDALGYWLERLGRTGKDRMEDEDWDKCKMGDPKALNKMQKYNRQDVRGGIELLIEFRDYLRSGGVDIFK